MPSSRHTFFVLTVLLCVALVSLLLALTSGGESIPAKEIFMSLIDPDKSSNSQIILSLRLPRALAGFLCGGLLALSGALLQILLRNPLADPYVLGISGGAGCGAILAILLGLGVAGINTAAFIGAMAAMLLVFGLARGDGSWTQTRLLLTGVIVAAGCGAFIALMLSIAPDHQLRGMLYWLMGDLSQANDIIQIGLVLLAALLLILPFARELNILSHGTSMARTLGVSVVRLRYIVYITASICTAAAVTQAGAIGFVGLITPHLVRLSLGNDQRLLLPASVLAGGSLLVIADTLARTVIAPQQLPVGVLTALIGVPVFLFLLARDARTKVQS